LNGRFVEQMFVPSSYNSLDELAWIYKSYAQEIEVSAKSRSRSNQNTPKRIIRKTSRSQFHYNALEELGQLYDVSFSPLHAQSESPPAAVTRGRPLSVIQEQLNDHSESYGNIDSMYDSSDEEIPPGEWSYDFPNYDDSSFQEDSAFESGDVTSEILNAPVLSPPKQRREHDETPKDTLNPAKMFLDGTMNKKSNYFELQTAADGALTEDEEVELPLFVKLTPPDIETLPDLPKSIAPILKRGLSSDHFLPTDLECFLEHLVSRGRLGKLYEIKTKYSRHSKSELQNLPREELLQVKATIENFDPYTRKERMLRERCLSEFGLQKVSFGLVEAETVANNQRAVDF